MTRVRRNFQGRQCLYILAKNEAEATFCSSIQRQIQRELGNPWVIHIKCPLFILKVVSLLAEFSARCLGKVSTLNADKYKIMKQRNWQCDISPLVEELGYRPEYPLDKGVKEIIAWYKKEGWL